MSEAWVSDKLSTSAQLDWLWQMDPPLNHKRPLQPERDECHASAADHTATEMVCFSPPQESILFADILLLGHIQQISRALPPAACSTGLKKVSHRGTDLEGRMGSGPAEVLLCSRPSGPGHMQPPDSPLAVT